MEKSRTHLAWQQGLLLVEHFRRGPNRFDNLASSYLVFACLCV